MDKNEIARYFTKAQLLAYLRQFKTTVLMHREAVDFVYKHRIWEGFWRYGWAAKILVLTGVIVGLKFLSIVFGWIRGADVSDPVSAISSMGNLMGQFAAEGYRFLFAGSMKYIIVVILEILIFHISRRTLSILTGKDSDAGLDAFLGAQKRMIKVVIRSWIMEMIATVLIKIFFGIFGFIDLLQPVVIFLVQGYYLGFAVVDNYHEQFGLSIKESAEEMRRYAGVALAVGIFLQLAFAIPVAGTLGGPVIATVAATLAMYELSDLHRRKQQVAHGLDPEEIV